MARRGDHEESVSERHYRLRLIANLTFEVVPIKSAEAAVAALPPASTVSITCSPVKGIAATAALTDRIRSAGHRVIPHLAARMVEGPDQVAHIAHWLRTEEIGQIFVVGGDAEHPAGPYPDGSSLLRALLDADPGLSDIGVPAYPDGHPLIDGLLLAEALHTKQLLLSEAGVAGRVSTQMCFNPQRISDWLSEARTAGMTLPVHLGLPGVIDRAKLMTMGLRLGVGASLRYLGKNRGAMGKLLSSSSYDPNRLLESLSPVLEPLDIRGLHCFTFNQVEATVVWQQGALAQV
jgi:methylenetetrahydrofolate reductase (NADPH)